MKSIIVTNRDANGEPGVGHVVVNTGQRHAAIQEAPLPATRNGNSSMMVMLAALMLGLGAAVLAVTRRRQLS